jgi:hypothetical protein
MVNSQWSQRILMSLLLLPRLSGMPALSRGQPLVGVQHLPAPCVSFFGIRRHFPVTTEPWQGKSNAIDKNKILVVEPCPSFDGGGQKQFNRNSSPEAMESGETRVLSGPLCAA